MNPDLQLRHDVFAALNWDPAVNGCTLDVHVKDGVVTLRGTVADERQRSAAESAVRRVDGIRTLVNRLTLAAATHRAGAARGTLPGDGADRTAP
jgi:osmotically-inducible protein OsmY